MKTFDIKAYDDLGNSLIKSQGKQSKAKEEVSTFQTDFSWLTLQIVLSGKLQEVQHLQNVFAKGNKFHAIRMVYSRARAVAKELNEKGQVTVSTKKESFIFTLEETKEANSMLFNVSTAYNSIKKAVEEKEESREELALKAYLEAFNTSKAEFEKIAAANPDIRKEAINQGLILLDDIEKEESAKKVPAMVEDIRAAFTKLQSIEDNTAYSLLQDLISLYQNDTAQAA